MTSGDFWKWFGITSFTLICLYFLIIEEQHISADFVFAYIYYYIMVYWIRKKLNVMELGDVNSLSETMLLDYKVVYNPISKTVNRIYVRPRMDIFWKEIDYPFTIKRYCNASFADKFTKDITTVQKLKEVMTNKSLVEKNINRKDKSDYDINLNIMMLIISTVISHFLYKLLF